MGSAFTPHVKALVHLRAGGRCDRCGITVQAAQFHHRRARGMGGTSREESGEAANCLLLHPACHEYIERHRTESYEKGWLVRQNDEPTLVPVQVQGRWCILYDNATVGFLSAGAGRGSPPLH